MLNPDSKPAYLFQRNQRLLTKADYGYVFQSAKRLSTRWFTVLYRTNKFTINFPRLGLVIAKKSAKRAVDRNQIKRKIRETFRLSQHQLPSIDIVVLSKKTITQANQQELTKELYYIWRKLIQ